MPGAVFRDLLAHHRFAVILWDLDATLGSPDGWCGGLLAEYIDDHAALARHLEYARAAGVRNVLASRNGRFSRSCPWHASAVDQACDFGFDAVVPNLSHDLTRSKVALAGEPGLVLLIDDCATECCWAIRDGAVAVQVHRVFHVALEHPHRHRVYFPDAPLTPDE